MRPAYAEPAQREAAHLIALKVVDRVGGRLLSLTDADPVEYAIVGANNVGLAGLDVRTRNVRHDKYPTTIISDKRITRALNMVKSAPLFIAISFTDGVYVFDSRRVSFTKMLVLPGGRKDRGDPQDVEMVRHFPMGHAVPIFNLDTLGVVDI